jgi:hypothetical protein
VTWFDPDTYLDFAVAEDPTAAKLDRIGSNFKAINSIPAARLTATVSQGITAGVYTTVNFDAEVEDTDACHDNSTSPHRLTCKTAGVYRPVTEANGRWQEEQDRRLGVLENKIDGLPQKVEPRRVVRRDAARAVGVHRVADPRHPHVPARRCAALGRWQRMSPHRVSSPRREIVEHLWLNWRLPIAMVTAATLMIGVFAYRAWQTASTDTKLCKVLVKIVEDGDGALDGISYYKAHPDELARRTPATPP